MLLHQLGDGCVDEHQLPDYVGHVDLVGDLVAGIHVALHLRPVGVDPDQVEEGLDVAEQEVADVVGLGGDLRLLVVEHDLPGEADLVGLLGVGAHDENEPDDGADQSPHVGEVGVQLVEGPLVSHRFGRLPEDNLDIMIGSSLVIGGGSHSFRNVHNGLGSNILIREQAEVSFNGIFLDIGNSINSQLRTKSEQILVSNVYFFVRGTVRVDIGVD